MPKMIRRTPGKGVPRRPRHENGRMNKTEQAFANEVIANWERDGLIEWWGFEDIAVRLADRSTYTPDFQVQHKDGTIVFIEVKAYWKSKGGPHWEDDARIKWKMCAKLYPFKVLAAWKQDGEWKFEEAKVD